jgi:hypothetical protein
MRVRPVGVLKRTLRSILTHTPYELRRRDEPLGFGTAVQPLSWPTRSSMKGRRGVACTYSIRSWVSRSRMPTSTARKSWKLSAASLTRAAVCGSRSITETEADPVPRRPYAHCFPRPATPMSMSQSTWAGFKRQSLRPPRRSGRLHFSTSTATGTRRRRPAWSTFTRASFAAVSSSSTTMVCTKVAAKRSTSFWDSCSPSRSWPRSTRRSVTGSNATEAQVRNRRTSNACSSCVCQLRSISARRRLLVT